MSNKKETNEILQRNDKQKTRYRSYVFIKRHCDIDKRCQICGKENSEIHHPDYLNYLDVNILCKKHHSELHANKIKQPQIIHLEYNTLYQTKELEKESEEYDKKQKAMLKVMLKIITENTIGKKTAIEEYNVVKDVFDYFIGCTKSRKLKIAKELNIEQEDK